ncbi:sulfotransferase family protein [Shewanella sp. D64]|nr:MULTISPECIES: sulfotransferase [unclassified Shewanella]MEC4727173.1 sulfotransferase family protein [Shewanella sp. D64]MEC4739210.1 sulfotransferase family protein [Shewanella sp. E94]WBJ98322.1 sulfotransferase family protein [Shewanella sp. MTB7]
MTKAFIIGLPRSGTTSVSVALLEQGFKVAHQAFTKQAFELADVVSDAPCFSDYKQLAVLYPQAKFIYLDRVVESWVPSMQMLLSRMLPHLDMKTGRFHPVLKRSFKHCFGVGEVSEPMDTQHLINCYQTHKKAVFDYFCSFGSDPDRFISIDISEVGSLSRLINFLDADKDIHFPNSNAQLSYSHLNSLNLSSLHLNFPHLNKGRNVASWDEYKHANKINSNVSGPEKRKFFDYKLV